LVRHGETTWNADGRIQGRADPPLNDRGRAQAEQLADRFRGDGIRALYSSPQQRARQTAERIAAATGLPIQFDDRLQEHDMGVFTGLTGAEIAERYPEFVREWAGGAIDIPGGETTIDFRARAVGVMQDIAARHAAGKVVVVAHGGLMAQFLAGLLDLDPARRHPFRFDNASVSIVDLGAVPRLYRLNDVSHLLIAVALEADSHAPGDEG
jgi:broad specificity phosphatase PhoE